MKEKRFSNCLKTFLKFFEKRLDFCGYKCYNDIVARKLETKCREWMLTSKGGDSMEYITLIVIFVFFITVMIKK